MSLVLNVEILGEFKKLTAATQGASKQLTGLQGTASKISSGINKAFGAIGIGLSFAFIARELQQASKAAVEDSKSQGLLATALVNTTGANDAQIASVEKSIKKLSEQAAVADDDLRPAFAKLARATGDVDQSTQLMSLALDVAAGTGKSLDTVVNALSRAVGPEGTTGALERLAPAIKGASDPLAELEKLFAGSAEKAAELDPYQKLKVAFGEISESVGKTLLPLLVKFSDWFLTVLPGIEGFFNAITGAFDSPEVKEAFGNLEESLRSLGKSLASLFGITSSPEANGFIQFFTILAQILDGIVTTVDLIVQTFGKAFPIFNAFSKLVKGISAGLAELAGYDAPENVIPGRISTPEQSTSNQNVTININRSNITAQEIADKLNRANRASGTNLIR